MAEETKLVETDGGLEPEAPLPVDAGLPWQ